MRMSGAVRFHRLYELFFSVSSAAANLLLLLLICRFSRGELRHYRVILLSSTLTDLLFVVVNASTMTCVVVSDGVAIVANLGPLLNSPRPVAIISTAFWVFTMSVTYTTLCFQFGYRFNYVAKEEPWSRRKVVAAYGLLILAAAFVSFFSISAFITAQPPETYAEILRNAELVVDDEPVGFVAVEGWGVGALVVIFHMSYCAACYGFVVYFAYRIRRKIKETRAMMSNATRNVQRQINSILFVQTILPLCLTTLPIVVNCFMALSKVNIPGGSEFLDLSVSAIPLANAMTVIVVVPSYRRAALRLLFSRLSLDTVGVRSQSSRSPVRPVVLPKFIYTVRFAHLRLSSNTTPPT